MKTTTRVLSRCALSAILFASCWASAQDTAPDDTVEKRWYRIHLAVFQHRTDAGDHEELWRKRLQLRYPRDLIRLKNREQYLADLCGLNPAANNQSQNGNRLIDILERVDSGQGYRPEDYDEPTTNAPLDPACREVRPDLFPETEQEKAASVVEEAKAVLSDTSSLDDEEDKPFEAPTPFVLAPAIDDEEFANMVNKINGAYRYRLLFSGSWAQSLRSREEATPLLIQGGDEVGNHFELEGFIKVALERYLHIDTHLWLSRFGQQISAADPYAASSAAPENTTAEPEDFPALPTPFPVNDPGYRPSYVDEVEPNDSDGSEPAGNDEVQERRPSSNLEVLLAGENGYTVERTVVMQQNRRMRSGEVHYLDHPLFGVLVKITPVAGPDKNQSSRVSTR